MPSMNSAPSLSAPLAAPGKDSVAVPLRARLLAAAQWGIPTLGWLGGIAAGGLHLYDGEAGAIAAILRDAKGWELSAFGAFGAMSGFALASLSLVASMSQTERGKHVVDSNPGRYLLRRMVSSMWWWLVPGVVALMHLVLPFSFVEALFFATAAIGVSHAFLALLALTLFFKRYTVDKPAEPGDDF